MSKNANLKLLDPTVYGDTSVIHKNNEFDFSGEDWAEQYKRYVAYLEEQKNKNSNQ